MKPRLFIGLMSGTSADSIDAALVRFDGSEPSLLTSLNHPLPIDVKTAIYALCQPAENEINRLGRLDQLLADCFSEAVVKLLAKAKFQATDICAIGSHGQTVRHLPPKNAQGFTLQIGDPNRIAYNTGITTVADFRRADMAAGGQGAPLAPGLHEALFKPQREARCIINIGGIANLTYLPAEGTTVGYDTGPGNALLDSWIQKTNQQDYDKDGSFGASGNVQPALLKQLMAYRYFHSESPKSTGREEFNLSWLQGYLKKFQGDVSTNDVQATLTEFTAQTIAQSVSKTCAKNTAIYLCGGGVHNSYLRKRIQAALPSHTIQTTETLGIPPDWVEAVAFAWLAMRTLDNLPGNLPAVTGADKAVVLGGVFQATSE